MRKIFFLFIAILTFLVLGCIGRNSEAEEISFGEQVKTKCTELCQSYIQDKTNGPCLSDENPEWNVSGWVCDIAHSPRQPVDNIPENQCKEFGEGRAEHFVEVNEECEIIKAV